MSTRRVVATAGVLLALGGVGGAVVAPEASAHAVFEGSTPAASSTVAELPERLVVRVGKKSLTLEADPLRVFDPTGARIDMGDARVDDDGSAISVGLRRSQLTGVFHIYYDIISADTHRLADHLEFSVAGGWGPATSGGGPVPAPRSSGEPAGLPSAVEDSGRGVSTAAITSGPASAGGPSRPAPLGSALSLHRAGTVTGSVLAGIVAILALALVVRSTRRSPQPQPVAGLQSSVPRRPASGPATAGSTPTHRAVRPPPRARRPAAPAPLGRGVQVVASSAGRTFAGPTDAHRPVTTRHGADRPAWQRASSSSDPVC